MLFGLFRVIISFKLFERVWIIRIKLSFKGTQQEEVRRCYIWRTQWRHYRRILRLIRSVKQFCFQCCLTCCAILLKPVIVHTIFSHFNFQKAANHCLARRRYNIPEFSSTSALMASNTSAYQLEHALILGFDVSKHPLLLNLATRRWIV